ncbi:MAG: hypothetical protein ACRD9S_01320 [Pyrinomonadaceae bacterium]
MESNSTNQEYFIGDLPLPEPHFDEEATLLSARPVVPLEEVKAEERSRKRLLFGLAMACSLLLGAFAATLIYKQRGQGQSTAVVTSAVSGAAGIAADNPDNVSPTPDDVAGAVTGRLPDADAATADKKSAPAPSSRVASAALVTNPGAYLPEPVVEQRELTRAERIEARRLRRRAERQARKESGDRQRKSSDGMLRIRDIFEGPSRP